MSSATLCPNVVPEYVFNINTNKKISFLKKSSIFPLFLYQLVFQAERTFSVLGDIAIDDISFDGCGLPPVIDNCRPEEFRCARGACIDMDRVCDYSDDCGDYSDESDCGKRPGEGKGRRRVTGVRPRGGGGELQVWGMALIRCAMTAMIMGTTWMRVVVIRPYGPGGGVPLMVF